jgi:hypothetical protein
MIISEFMRCSINSHSKIIKVQCIRPLELTSIEEFSVAHVKWNPAFH